jgi:hypothetical protein
MSSWPIWTVGAVLLIGAGFAAVVVPRLRAELPALSWNMIRIGG